MPMKRQSESAAYAYYRLFRLSSTLLQMAFSDTKLPLASSAIPLWRQTYWSSLSCGLSAVDDLRVHSPILQSRYRTPRCAVARYLLEGHSQTVTQHFSGAVFFLCDSSFLHGWFACLSVVFSSIRSLALALGGSPGSGLGRRFHSL